jgi:MFS superfamily sulfate permease-like transporter
VIVALWYSQKRGMLQSESQTESINFVQELWRECRPYLLAICKDAVVCVSLYAVLLAFHWIFMLFPVPGWEGQWIQHIHGIGIIVAFTLFAWLIVKDLYKLHKK